MDKIILLEVVEDQQNVLKEELIIRDKLGRAVEDNPFVIVISGVRRCGKSTLLNEIKKTKDGYYFNFDDERLINFKVEDFQKLYEILLELYGEKDVFFFDEIQNIEGWERFVRRLHDYKKKVYVTGSNASMLSRELGTHLTGRHLNLRLFPFSFNEFLNFKNIEIKELDTSTRVLIKKSFKEYLEKGGFPEFLKTDDKEYLKIVYDNIIYRDVLARYKLANAKVLKELVYFIASNIAKEISFNSIKKLLRFGSSTTVKEYFDYLEDSYLIFLISKYSRSIKKQIYANKKAYFIDTALAITNGYRLTQDRGRLLENAVFLELKRRGKEIYYFKEKGECDFIIKEGIRVKEAIQVTETLNENNRKREVNGLLEALERLGLKKGLLLTYDQEEEIKANHKKITVKPIWKWLLGK